MRSRALPKYRQIAEGLRAAAEMRDPVFRGE